MTEKLDPTKLPYQRFHYYEELLEEIILQIVDNPSSVVVDEMEGENGVLTFNVKIHEDDKGKVIGKQGTTIGALHKLFAVISRQFVKINLLTNANEPVR